MSEGSENSLSEFSEHSEVVVVNVNKPPKLPAMTSYEKNLLLDLVLQHRRVLVECKSSDSKTIRSKSKVWREIEKTFCNDRNTTTRRTAEQLRIWWKNCKLRSKQLIIDHHQILAQGLRPSSSGAGGIEAEKIYQIVSGKMSPLPMNPVVFEYDDDYEYEDTEVTSVSSYVAPAIKESKHVPVNPVPEPEPFRFQNDIPEPDVLRPMDVEFECPKVKSNAVGPVEMEYEEHRIRLKILETELETAQLKRRKAEIELNAASNEHQLRIQLLSAQVSAASQPGNR